MKKYGSQQENSRKNNINVINAIKNDIKKW